MTIRGQNLLFLVPVFLVAGLLIGGLKWAADTSTLESGGKEQIRTFAVALREFLEARERLSGAPGLASIQPELLRRDLNRVQQLFDLRKPQVTTSAISTFFWPDETSSAGAPGVVILDPESRKVAFSYAPEGFEDIGARVTELTRQTGVMGELRGEGVYIADFDVSLNSPENLWALAILKNTRGEDFAILGVQYDGSWIKNEMRASIVEIGIGVLVAALAGVVIALFLASILSRTLGNLTEAASRAAEGDYDVRIRSGLIEEFNDLGNTFRTMTSLLYDTLDRIRKTLIEQEQFRNTDDLMSTFRSNAYEKVSLDEDWMQAEMGPLRTQNPGHFYQHIPLESGHFFMMGWVHDSSEPDDLIASALCRYVDSRIRKKQEIRDLLNSAFEIFPIRKLISVELQPNPAHGKMYLLDSEHKGAEAVREEFGSVPESGLVFHTLTEAFGQRIETALRHMERGSAKSAHEQIRAITLPGEDGIVLYIRGHV
ncbi:MAG: methyl-accepting chemotaxis protein [Leptospiraceae bacterium]